MHNARQPAGRRQRRLMRNVSTKITEQEHGLLSDAAFRQGRTLSDFTRQVLLSSVSVSPEARTVLHFSAMQSEFLYRTLRNLQAGTRLTEDKKQALQAEAADAAVAQVERMILLLQESSRESSHGE